MMKESSSDTIKLSHIWLYVKDTSRSIKFYRDVIRFKVVETFPHGALFDAGSVLLGVHREVSIRSQPGSTVLILKTNNIEKAHSELRARGLVFEGKIRQESYGKIVYFKDPDGYSWELVEEPITSQAQFSHRD